MEITRRDFLRASGLVAGAIGLSGTGLFMIREAQAKSPGGLPVIWLQG